MLEIGKPQVRMNEGQSSSAKLEAPRTITQSQERPNEIILDTPVEQKLQRNDPTKEDEEVIDTTLRVGAMESESTENPKAPPFTITSKPFPNNTKLDNANRTFYFSIKLNGKQLQIYVDPGATHSYLGRNSAMLVKDHIKPHKISFRSANGTIDPCFGIVAVDITVDGYTSELHFRVSNALDYDCIFGADFFEKFKIKVDYEKRTWQGPGGTNYPMEKKNSHRKSGKIQP